MPIPEQRTSATFLFTLLTEAGEPHASNRFSESLHVSQPALDSADELRRRERKM